MTSAHDRGDTVTVAYDRERPELARIDSTSSSIGRWIVPMITGVLGVTFTAAGLLVLSVCRATHANEEPAS